MKKSIKKLRLNKATISNLDTAVMDQKIGGAKPKTTSILVLCPSVYTCINFCGTKNV